MTELRSDDEFAQVVRLTPLVAIDVVVRRPDRRVLVGMRTNEPAKGFYFVPGGRIRKGERLRQAFERILFGEIGCQSDFADAVPLGGYEHIYPSNRFGDSGYGTHYVVLAYQLNLRDVVCIQPDGQHSAFVWMTEEGLLASPQVHPNTKAYFE